MEINNYIKKINYFNKNIYYLEINNTFINNYNIFISLFCDKNDLNRLNKFIFDNDKYRHLGSIILQKFVVRNFTDLFNSNLNYINLVIFRDKYNKPYILNPLTSKCEINYNVSHDDKIVIIIFDQLNRVGIDIMSNNQEKRVNKLDIKFW